jgi:hypothetical protein
MIRPIDEKTMRKRVFGYVQGGGMGYRKTEGVMSIVSAIPHTIVKPHVVPFLYAIGLAFSFRNIIASFSNVLYLLRRT